MGSVFSCARRDVRREGSGIWRGRKGRVRTSDYGGMWRWEWT